MCGLAAVFSYSSLAPLVDEAELLRTREAMSRRGPDGAGLWVSEDRRIGLGHRRLAIIDTSVAGVQPMATPDGLLRIVFNGEIYNYRDLRDRLEGKGHVFFSGTDTEVLLHAYREYGESVVEHLRGMFAFVIWDEQKRGVFLARDHFGIKPLYFHDDGLTLRVASQVKAVLAGGNIQQQPEPAGHVGFFLWGCVPEPYTLHRGVFALQAGHTLWVGQDGPRQPRKYFDVAEELGRAAAITDHRDTEEILTEALRDSVKHHLIADVPVGVFLSSGLDSATLAALASEAVNGLHAVTLGFGEYRGTLADEVPLARQVAAHYGCTHHVSDIARQDFEEALPEILHAMDQPSIDGVNTYFVARAARSAGLKVALSGVGGDELLGGYPSFRQIPASVSRLQAFSHVPWLGRSMRVVSAPWIGRVASPKFASLFEYGGTYSGAYLLRRGLFMPWELPNFLDGEFVREGWTALQPLARLDKLLRPVGSARANVAAMEMSLYMRNMLLRDADWAGMANSLEIRTPLVDIALFRALAPWFSNTKGVPEKRHLGAAPGRALPAAVLNRPKTGFSVPVRKWLSDTGARGNLRGLRAWSLMVNSIQKCA